MGKITTFLVILLLLVVVGGVGFLAIWDAPAPSSPVEKVIPDSRFPK